MSRVLAFECVSFLWNPDRSAILLQWYRLIHAAVSTGSKVGTYVSKELDTVDNNSMSNYEKAIRSSGVPGRTRKHVSAAFRIRCRSTTKEGSIRPCQVSPLSYIVAYIQNTSLIFSSQIKIYLSTIQNGAGDYLNGGPFPALGNRER